MLQVPAMCAFIQTKEGIDAARSPSAQERNVRHLPMSNDQGHDIDLMLLTLVSFGLHRVVEQCMHNLCHPLQTHCLFLMDTHTQITNKCPFCKLRFSSISSTDTSKVIQVEQREQRVERDDLVDGAVSEYDDAECQVCGSGDSEYDHLSLLCDGCDEMYHTFCVGLDDVPSDPLWFCPKTDCVAFKDSLQRIQHGNAENGSAVKDGSKSNGQLSEAEPNADDEEWLPEQQCKKGKKRKRGDVKVVYNTRLKRSRHAYA